MEGAAMSRRFTPRTLARVIQVLNLTGKWSGERKGVKVRLKLAKQGNLAGERVEWRAYFKSEPAAEAERGRAGTVAEAFAQIEEALRP